MRRNRRLTRSRAKWLAPIACAVALPIAAVSASGAVNWSNVTSAKAGGGFAALVKAAKAEGTLNLIADPLNWANYGEIISSFSKKYGIKVNDVNKLGTSQQEITALQTLGSQSRAPDAVDVGQSYALNNASLFAPYKVQTWNLIPAANKAANGTWANDYGGYVSIGCNTSIVKVCPTSFADLTNPAYKNDVALDDPPTTANSAFSGVWAAALANGGSFDNITPGITFFQKLHQIGNFVETPGLAGAITAGQTPIVIDWDYNNAATAVANKGKFKWTTAVPTDASFAAFYAQALSAKAPHPAAARLWLEYLYSATGQNLWLKGLSRPVELPAMIKNGTVNKTYLKALPAVAKPAKYPSLAQVTAAEAVVAQQWASSQS
ncbi:MAG TPA: ABC transporter substrate-binding protein [Solirubrobacteraceae bacterium]|nr:ABC transporter substrate-binding protein [Solirubrobacteraceae bacterium]